MSPRQRRLLGVLDQAVTSLTNVAVLIIAAASLSATELASVALALTFYALIISGVQATAVDVGLSVRGEADLADSRFWGAAALIGLASGLLLLGLYLASLLLGEPINTLLVMGFFVPILVAQDSGRFVCFARGLPLPALASDVAWLVAGAIGVVLLSPDSGSVLILLWGLCGALSAALLFGVIRQVPFPLAGATWIRSHQRSLSIQGADFALSQGAGYLGYIALGLVGGTVLWAATRLLSALYGPVNIVMNAMRLTVYPGMRMKSGRVLTNTALRVSAVGLLATLGTVVLFSLVPDGPRGALLGAGAGAVSLLWVPFGVSIAGLALAWGPVLAMRSGGAFARLFRIRLIVAPIVVVLPSLGWILGGYPGVSVSFVVLGCLFASIYWMFFYSTTKSVVWGINYGLSERNLG